MKTSKKKVKARFKFTSSEAGSSFACKLDRGGFKGCDSPFVAKVRKGKHKFKVRATDASGNADPTPASYRWKVKPKRKR